MDFPSSIWRMSTRPNSSLIVIMERYYGFEIRYVDVVSRGEINTMILRITVGHQARITTLMMI